MAVRRPGVVLLAVIVLLIGMGELILATRPADAADVTVAPPRVLVVSGGSGTAVSSASTTVPARMGFSQFLQWLLCAFLHVGCPSPTTTTTTAATTSSSTTSTTAVTTPIDCGTVTLSGYPTTLYIPIPTCLIDAFNAGTPAVFVQIVPLAPGVRVTTTYEVIGVHLVRVTQTSTDTSTSTTYVPGSPTTTIPWIDVLPDRTCTGLSATGAFNCVTA